MIFDPPFIIIIFRLVARRSRPLSRETQCKDKVAINFIIYLLIDHMSSLAFQAHRPRDTERGSHAKSAGIRRKTGALGCKSDACSKISIK